MWLERIFISLSFAHADTILTGRSFGSLIDSLPRHLLAGKRLVVADTVVDAIPSDGFFRTLKKARSEDEPPRHSRGANFVLIYVGRLHREKLVEGLVRMMARLKNSNIGRVTLNLVGEGPEKPALQALSKELDVESIIRFVGSVRNEDLPNHLTTANAFVSPLTGTSLREAALCGLPIVAYDMDWIRGILRHEETALLVPPNDFEEMARQVMRLINDVELRERLSRNVRELAWRLWSPDRLQESLSQAFREVSAEH
jgi:glycosyltransferase involved in cell wall biosynthesis